MKDFIENITGDAYVKLNELDKSFIGTLNYMGVAYFWHHDYRHYLRGASQEQRQEVHSAFLKAGLKLDGSSAAHDKIIWEITGVR